MENEGVFLKKCLKSEIIYSRLTHDQYNIICAKILNLFPNEIAQTFYYSGERINNLAVQAKGKLVYKAHNILYHSPDKLYVRKRKNCSVLEDINKKKIRKDTEDEKNAVIWLKHNREPWEDVFKNWKLTYNLRSGATNFNSVVEFLREWPIISDPRADSLIESDFAVMHPGKDLMFKFLLSYNSFCNL
ncbi:unnamed protein product [Brassicogethes aeneus]|uniref:Uncharacterized protein n=1 Tax=Brassicogethes aeneus TaxID=1431903 RepID=A0A9P0BAE6_BRAAE|nr:unnamed protein product [Brassicogethes aeneus]